MKKLLLSSIIIFGVCGIVSAQNATTTTDSKVKQKSVATTNSITTATPQKSAMATSDVATPVAATTADDVNAARPAAKQNAVRPAQATTVNAAGEVVNTPESQQRAGKLAAAKAANAKKTQNN